MRRLVVFASLLGFVAMSSALAGPVAVNDENIIIRVQIPSIVEGEPPIDETRFTDTSPFNDVLDESLNQQDQTNSALASQDSNFGNAGDVFTANATGETRYSATGVSGIVSADSEFSIQFSIDTLRNYTITGLGEFPDTGAGASNFEVSLSGPGGEVFSFTKADFNPNNNDGAIINAPFDTAGTLTPGGYQLTARSGVSGGTNITAISARYQVAFTATEAHTPPPTPIPLPAGATPGAIMLAGLGAIALRKRARA